MKVEKISLLLVIITILIGCNDKESTAPRNYQISISVELMDEFALEDEWIRLQIVKSPGESIIYDTIATVSKEEGFKDELSLEAGSYKCFIPDIGAMVNMPIIKLYNGEIVEWGYPDIEAFVFNLPAK